MQVGGFVAGSHSHDAFNHRHSRTLGAAVDGKNCSFHGNQTIAGGDIEASGALLGGLNDDVAAIEVDGRAPPFASDGKIGAFIHLDQRPIEQTNHGVGTLRRADFIAVLNLVSGWNQMHLVVGNGVEGALHILNRSADRVLSREQAIAHGKGHECDGNDRGRSHGPSPNRKVARCQCGLPNRLHFAVTSLLDRVPAGHALVHVVFKQQPAGLGQILAEISRDERLKILAALQFMDAERWRCGNRTPDALACLGNHAVLHVFIANIGN